MQSNRSPVAVGRIAGSYGVKGWVRVQSFTHPAENVFAYVPWTLRDQTGSRAATTVDILARKAHGKGWVVQLDGVADRSAADAMKGLEIAVEREQMPELEAGRFYWTDLEGLRVENRQGTVLGHVDQLLETGSTDVMVALGKASGERHLIPFIMNQSVLAVDLDAGCIRVDWNDED